VTDSAPRITQISETQFEHELGSFLRSSFRLETLRAYGIPEETPELAAFMAGNPVPPPQVDWWRDWLDQVRTHTRAGRTVTRVRLTDSALSPYQRWMAWADPWYAEAGEQVLRLPRLRAAAVGVPSGQDWYLLDDTRLIIMWFTAIGEVAGKTLITHPGVVARYRAWRDLAVREAAPAKEAAA
jgi:hypothetical protein